MRDSSHMVECTGPGEDDPDVEERDEDERHDDADADNERSFFFRSGVDRHLDGPTDRRTTLADNAVCARMYRIASRYGASA